MLHFLVLSLFMNTKFRVAPMAEQSLTRNPSALQPHGFESRSGRELCYPDPDTCLTCLESSSTTCVWLESQYKCDDLKVVSDSKPLSKCKNIHTYKHNICTCMAGSSNNYNAMI